MSETQQAGGPTVTGKNRRGHSQRTLAVIDIVSPVIEHPCPRDASAVLAWPSIFSRPSWDLRRKLVRHPTASRHSLKINRPLLLTPCLARKTCKHGPTLLGVLVELKLPSSMSPSWIQAADIQKTII